MLYGIRTCLGVSNIPVDFFLFLSTEFAAYSKPPSRDNHRKASHPRAQQRFWFRRETLFQVFTLIPIFFNLL